MLEIVPIDRLMNAVAAQARKALASGALLPIESDTETVTDGGVDFLVRTATNLRRKAKAGALRNTGHLRDPFSPPYEADLLLGSLSTSHVVLLNKFNVLDHHLLIVTRAWQDQERLLDRDDFAALLSALAAVDGLGFYNGGREAGASQRHKHMQLVPLPLAPGYGDVPLESLFRQGRGHELPFVNAVAPVPTHWWQAPAQSAEEVLARYQQLLTAIGVSTSGKYQDAPYNLLMTRRWLWLVPRTHETFDGIPVNALGFAGALLARDKADLATLKRHGPMRVLTAVGVENPEPNATGR